MFRLINKTRKYQTPLAKVTRVTFESNFCQTMRLNAQVDELDNINTHMRADGKTTEEQLYFEF